MKKTFHVFMIGALCAASGFAEEAKAPAAAPTEAEKQAKMAEMQKLMQPGENHKVLDAIAGKFNAKVTMWMEPGKEPEVSTGVTENTWVYGGRFLQQKYTGTFQGQPFEGTGIVGYDNVKKEYISIWYDSMMTGIMSSAGQYDAATKTLTEKGTVSCPMSGQKDMPMRTALTITDNDHHVYDSYAPGPDGKEMKGMSIAYERVK